MTTTVEVKKRPILFSGQMVRAILDGRKTQTRRTIKPQPDYSILFGGTVLTPRRIPDMSVVQHGKQEWGLFGDDGDMPCFGYDCPYGRPGDRLWVRETWQSAAEMNQCHGSDDYYVYRATDPGWESMNGWKWRPSIFMPRDACRITLEITDVRIEQLQAISNADIAAEGIEPIGEEKTIANGSHFTQCGRLDGRYSTMRQLWSELWAKINGQESWDANPWVWVVEFAKTEN